MKKDTQLLLALAAGLSPDHKLVQTAANSKELSAMFLGVSNLKKEDVFSTAESGVSFFNNSETWSAMPRIIAMLRQNGEQLSAADFTQKIDGGNTLLGYAEKFNKLEELFQPESWKDNLDEMEKLWFSTTERFRKMFDFWAAYQETAKLSGTGVRENVYAEAGLEIDDIMGYLVNGQAHIVDASLKRRGHKLTKDDVFLVNKTGKTISSDAKLWDCFDTIHRVLKANNEELTLEDYTRSRLSNPSLFDAAVQNARVSSFFTQKLWRGQMADMLTLWEKVPEEKRAAVDIQTLLTDIEDHEFSHLIDLDKDYCKQDFVSPVKITLATDAHKSFDIRLLGLQKTWHNIWSLDSSTKKGLPDVGLEELRQPHGYFGQSCMHAAIRYGFLEVVIDMLRAKGEWFSIDDLTDKNSGQPSLLEHVIKQEKLDLIIAPENWIGSAQKRDDMIKLWQRLPDMTKKSYDIDGMLGKLNRLNLRDMAQRRQINSPKP